MQESEILITGAAGLIGSAVVRELNHRGYTNLILVDHLGETEKWKNLRSLQFNQYLEKEPFREILEGYLEGISSSESSLLEDVSGIIHLGACSSTTEYDASYLIDNNYQYSIDLARFAKKRNIRMVYASSAATYGDGENGFNDTVEGLETLRPLNPYGYSKQVFDQWILANPGFSPLFAGLKYFNVYGPNEYHKGYMQSVVLKGFRQIRDTGKIGLFKSYRDDYGDGEQKRDFLYVKDAARITVFFLLEQPEACGLFNVGSGTANTWLDLAHGIFAAMNKEPNIEFIDMPEEMRAKYQYYTCAPINRIREAGYADHIGALRESIGDYVQNYLLPGELHA
ncbi:MAG: ADP-glyceromanno-heptose 6-epimerase [Spirochaetaceae bacterium]|nr:ADP-glyceromanno-heptose 6-epimerase [Spirochaetaceae bacterium]|tara:strand:+ start:119935 stop:120951 length:1017 start_codon:yes stop_codon:yes gene_type:complete